MAGAFSGHLLDSFKANPQTQTPSIVTNGTMTFDARQHGSPFPFSNTPFQPLSFSGFGASPFPFSATGQSHVSEESAIKIATLQAKLNKKLGPEYVSQRPGPGNGSKLTYAEGWKIINLANEVFGFNGWSSSIVNLTTDFVDRQEDGRFSVGVTAIVRVTLRDGAYHEDVGYGLVENVKSKAAALDKCKKEAITDALKRTLRNFGNLLGNCLYDKTYALEVVKIKVPPAKFDKSELYRRPEFEESKPGIPSAAKHGVPESTGRNEGPAVKREPPIELPETPITYIPRHLRQEVAAAAAQQQATPTREQRQGRSTSVPSAAGPSERKPPSVDAHAQKPLMGLYTPIHTPAQRPQHQSHAPGNPLVYFNARRVSFSDMPPPRNPSSNPGTSKDDNAGTSSGADTRGGTSPRAPPAVAAPIPDEDSEDAYPLSTQEGDFFATVDLGEGDLGRPIDFEEGLAGESALEDSMAVEVQAEAPKAIQRVPSASSVSAGASAGRPVSAMPSLPNSGVGPSGGAGEQADKVSTSTSTLASGSTSVLTPGTRAGPTSNEAKCPPKPSMGGPSFPPGVKAPTLVHHQPPKPVPVVVPKAVVNLANGNTPKRSADVMQASSSTAARTPIQGMGLAQRQHQHQHPHPDQPQNAVRRHLLDPLEGRDTKRIKR